MILDPENYLPQHSPMCLLDSILEVNEKSAHCQSLIKESNIFYDPTIGGIYAWIGIELMAQTTGIFAHFKNPMPIPRPQLGFLVSVRKFSSLQPYFKLNDLLTIVADNEYLQDNMGVFQCSIIINNKIVASAKLSVFQPSPDQLKTYIE